MRTHVDTAAAIRAEGTNLFLTRQGSFLPMGTDTLFLEEDAETAVLNTWLGEARRSGVPEVVRVSRIIDIIS